MRKITIHILSFILAALQSISGIAQLPSSNPAFNKDSVLTKMYSVNQYFLDNQWKQVDRNWIRGTYFTGLMAFYNITNDEELFEQSRTWAAKHGWRTGTEWIYPANRMTCVQTYLELYFIDPDENKIENAREVMDKKIEKTEPAADQGWDYVDALYVGTPAYIMMSEASKSQAYAAYGHRMFRDVYNDLYDTTSHLFYRDVKGKGEKSRGGKKVFWSRGNGWAIASIPRIIDHLSSNDEHLFFYSQLLKEMALALSECQGSDGFWRVNLADSIDYPAPESSGTAFFTYALAWGINQGFLDKETYLPVIDKSWTALFTHVSAEGKVLWGQDVARGPEPVSEGDSHEYVAGAFLLAGSQILILTGSK